MPYSGDAGVAVVVPIKSFRLAKGRLAQVLNDAEREELARLTAQRVVEAAAGCALFVVCDDDDVAEWAAGVGARVVRPAASGLNAAALAGRRAAADAGATRVIVVHSDLPIAEALLPLATHHADVVVVPDRHLDGTNALVVPATGDFDFCYGPGSASQHQAQAAQRGLTCALVTRPDLALDLDTHDDLVAFRALGQR
ncbi:MAG: 2-phospho-L-lactate guanylyltransferase [Actinobacteria bacterium]|nr:2-phospho-L-lactate guanylyltransferase [Actinomycetota bacterium]NBT21190.1 2-phospho-L-lactate guanylyltransferase [Actinomycetota bacterium]